MKNFKFNIIETWFGGTKMKQITVKARTEKSAFKKIYTIMGNRCWDVELEGVSK